MNKLKTFLALTALATVVSQASFAKEEKYVLEPNHTSVLWSANHFGFTDVTGKFTDISGTIIFDEANPQKSSVEAVIKIAGLHTGLEKFDEHLKSKDFFNAKDFSTAKFVSKKVTVTGKNKAKIEGELTLLNVTKTVVLNAKLNKSAVSPISQKQTLGFSATTSIKRSDFGINYAIPGVSDKVDLIIQAEANL